MVLNEFNASFQRALLRRMRVVRFLWSLFGIFLTKNTKFLMEREKRAGHSTPQETRFAKLRAAAGSPSWAIGSATRLVLIGFAIVVATACKPEISRNTYFCGPEGLCPPDLSCLYGGSGTFTYSCDLPSPTKPALCPQDRADLEPDNTPEQARDLGAIDCGQQIQLNTFGCIDAPADIDFFEFTHPNLCTGSDPRARITMRVPLGAAPLRLELVDSGGTVVAIGEICTSEFDNSGTEKLCIDYRDIAVGTYRVRISLEPGGGADCNGACSFNRYQLVVSSPVT